MTMARTKGAKDLSPRKVRTGLYGAVVQPQPEEGYNSRRIAFMQAIMPTEPLDYYDVPEMERRFDRYLQLCQEYDMKVGNLAAYAAIGIDKALVWDWENNQSESEANRSRIDFVKKVKKICAMYREGLMEDGKINPVTGIFWQKNYDGFKDQQEVVVTPSNPLGELPSETELRKQIEDAIVVDDPEVT